MSIVKIEEVNMIVIILLTVMFIIFMAMLRAGSNYDDQLGFDKE